MNFKINSIPVFKFKNDNFKTQDFSPLIEGVLAGVHLFRLDVVLSTHIPVFIFLFHSLNYLAAIGFIIERIQYVPSALFFSLKKIIKAP